MSKRSVWASGLKMRINGRHQLGCDPLAIDPVVAVQDRRTQRNEAGFQAQFTCRADIRARDGRWKEARQEGHPRKFGNWPSNFRSALTPARRSGCIILT